MSERDVKQFGLQYGMSNFGSKADLVQRRFAAGAPSAAAHNQAPMLPAVGLGLWVDHRESPTIARTGFGVNVTFAAKYADGGLIAPLDSSTRD